MGEERRTRVDRHAVLRLAVQELVNQIYPELAGEVVTEAVVIVETMNEQGVSSMAYLSSADTHAKEAGMALAHYVRMTSLLQAGWGEPEEFE